MKMLLPTRILLVALGFFCFVIAACAWERKQYSVTEVVSRADLIVVGKINPGSIVFVPHDPKNGGASWEHHVELQISEVLKGQALSNSMIVSIHYGLDPDNGRNRIDVPWSAGTSTNEAIELLDTGNTKTASSPVAGDIQTNHIWLLHSETNSANHDSDWIGIYDPEDIQSMTNKDELLRYLK
jgi:hypothetical protein